MDAFLPGACAPVGNPFITILTYGISGLTGRLPKPWSKAANEPISGLFSWNDFAADKNHSVPEAARAAYVAAYSRAGRMHAGGKYFVSFIKAANDFAQLSQTKLTMPVLSIGGNKSLGEALGAQAKLVATDATVVVLKDTGHWLLEENPKKTTDALMNFL